MQDNTMNGVAAVVEAPQQPSSAEQAASDLQQFVAAAGQCFADDDSQQVVFDSLGPKLVSEFNRAQADRKPMNTKWLANLRAYRGIYEPGEEAGFGRRSKVFVRKTRVKIKTVNSRAADMVFPAGREKNWSISPTPEPNVTDELKARVAKLVELAVQAKGSNPSKDEVDALTMDEVKKACAKMSSYIDDQIADCRYKQTSLKVMHSGHLYGTGIMKGPLVERKIRSRFKPDGKGGWINHSESYLSPFVEHVPIWRFYPDMSVTDLEDCRFVFEHHKMTQKGLNDLAARGKSFNSAAIRAHILANPLGSETLPNDFDSEVDDIGERQGAANSSEYKRYDVLERWGWLEGTLLKDAGVPVPEGRLHETFFSNVWMFPNGKVFRAVLQPIDGVTWPYRMYYFDKDETSIFGEGLASIMSDDQAMLNAATRMILDNAALTSGPQLEVIERFFSGMEKVDEFIPWKIWKRNAEQPGQPGIKVIELPSRLNELSSIASLFDGNLDEITAIPRYMSGENATAGAAGTASGMSMLLGAANIVMKDLVTAWDEGVTRPFFRDLYKWNMQFNTDPECKGDFEVSATGVASLVAKEVRAQQLNAFAAATNNPTDLPLIKRINILRQIAEASELADAVKTDEELRKEQESEQAQAMVKLQIDLAQAELAKAQAQTAKMLAEVDLIREKAKETMANIDNIIAQTVEKRVASVFAALQTGGMIVQTPMAAPAGDEILASSGWKDLNGDPTIGDLGAATQVVPQAPAGVPTVVDPPPPQPDQPDSGFDIAAAVQPDSGAVGLHGGIETARIE